MKFLVLKYLSVWALLLAFLHSGVEAKFSHTHVHRSLNLGTKGSNIVYDKLEMNLINTDSKSSEKYVFQFPKARGKIIRFKAYQNDKKEPLDFTETNKKGEATTFTISWKSPVPAGQSSKLKIILLNYNRLKPLPESIPQGADQFLLYEDTFGYKLDGPTEEFTMTVELPDSMKPIAFPTENPYQVNGKSIKYGPYKNDMTSAPLRLHFRSQQMGLTVEEWRREVWVRNYGSTLEFEDHIDIAHEGAKLKGSFSRLDIMKVMYQHVSLPMIESVELRLPPAIRELYYRDDTGNVSTSAVRYRSDMTQFLVKPRYVLFGGWKYNWYHGFSMKATSMLKALTKEHFQLNIPAVHPFSNPDVIARKYQLSVVLPESAQLLSVRIQGKEIPYTESTSYYYFDTTGRPTLHLHQDNVYCSKPDMITVEYTLPPFAYFQKPLAAVGAFVAVSIGFSVFKKIFFGRKH